MNAFFAALVLSGATLAAQTASNDTLKISQQLPTVEVEKIHIGHATQTLVLKPHQALIRRARELGVTAPIIGFPRGSAALAPRAEMAAAMAAKAVV